MPFASRMRISNGASLTWTDACAPSMTTGGPGSDRLTQARVVGLVQTAKVMGLQTVAKRVLGGDHTNWLTALGVDFVQSFEVSPPVSLDSLLAPVA